MVSLKKCWNSFIEVINKKITTTITTRTTLYIIIIIIIIACYCRYLLHPRDYIWSDVSANNNNDNNNDNNKNNQ